METLKRITLTFVLILSGMHAMSQSQAAIQAAFSKSYESEQSGKYTTAINDLKAVYKADSYIFNIRLGWLHYMAKQYSESIQYYEKAIKLKPYAIEARFGCVKPLSAIENWDRVKANYVEILKIDPQNTVANYWLGVVYYNRKNYLSASKLLEKVVNLYPLDYDSTILLAWSKLNLGKASEAKWLFQQALIIRPDDSSALSGLKMLQ